MYLIPLSVYIHYPYCASICPYCDFNKYKISSNYQEIDLYYINEIDFYLKTIDIKKFYLRSIFFGGGTPSLMSINGLQSIIEKLKNNFVYNDTLEITIEVNPTNLDKEKFLNFYTIGINRVSIGVQSIKDKDLQKFGRMHTASEAIKSVEIAHTIFNNISI